MKVFLTVLLTSLLLLISVNVASATTVAQAESTFKAYARTYCGNGNGACVWMGQAYCSERVRGISFSCTANWIETKTIVVSFRNQMGWGNVFQGIVTSFDYRTTS